MHEKAPPVLYKFRHFDRQGQHISLITQSNLWFANAKDFNDPFDIGFAYNFDGLETDLAVEWARNSIVRHESHLSPEQREVRVKELVNRIRTDPDFLQKMKANQIDYNQKTFGICSLCATRSNLLLWAHYSEHHTGFCVGLSVRHLNSISLRLLPNKTLLDLHQVKYSDTCPSPNFFRSMIHLEDTQHIKDVIETKSTEWNYEKEWRLVFWEHVGEVLQIGHESILEVILGCRISNADRKAILSVCHKYLPHAKIFQAIRKERQFGLDFHQISA